MITLQLLGGACLRSGGTAILGPPIQRHRIALLTLIVDAWPQPLSRDRAIALLWPERDQKSGRRLLNLAVHVLRGALGEAAITSVGDGLLLNPALLTCDLHELRAAIAGDDPDGVARLYTGPLLDGFHLADSLEFSHWLDGRRSELARAFHDALLALADRYERAGDARALVNTCLRLVDTDPCSPAHALRLMRALDAAGERRAAIDHAATYARRVREELDLPPDPRVAAALRPTARPVRPPRRWRCSRS
jgi:DNA-binding SARP family transcriptional activator